DLNLRLKSLIVLECRPLSRLGEKPTPRAGGHCSWFAYFSSPRRLSRAPRCTGLLPIFSLASFYQEARFHAGGISLFMVEGCRLGMVTCSHASATGKTRRTRCSGEAPPL